MQPPVLTAATFYLVLLPLSVYASSTAAPAPVSSASVEDGSGGVDVLAFFVVALVIGVATYHVLAVTKIPYTALLIVGSLTAPCYHVAHKRAHTPVC